VKQTQRAFEQDEEKNWGGNRERQPGQPEARSGNG
jgi:hypothetical protein